jgi:hypothetical protein
MEIATRQVDVNAAVAVQPARDHSVVEHPHLQPDGITQARRKRFQKVHDPLELLGRAVVLRSCWAVME